MIGYKGNQTDKVKPNKYLSFTNYTTAGNLMEILMKPSTAWDCSGVPDRTCNGDGC